MPVAIAVDDRTPEALIELAQGHDVRQLYLRSAAARPRTLRGALKASGVTVCGVATTPTALPGAERAASALRANALVVRVEHAEVEDLEAAVEPLARALHAPLARDVPVAVQNYAWLDLQALEWLFEALPGLRLWFVPREDTPIDTWASAYAHRCAGLLFEQHPETIDRGIVDAFSPRTPWVLDLEDGALADGVKALRAMLRA